MAGIIGILSIPSITCHAEIAGDEAFSGLTWNQVFEEEVQTPYGVVQSICVTDHYIICMENIDDSAQGVDIVSAYYRNHVDENGNEVEPYTLAKRVQEENWEHCNGMTYNPNTHEIYVALYTNANEANRGCIFVMDPDTLKYKRTIKISDQYNILGIDYDQERQQYVIQTDASGQYSFKILNENFEVVQELGSCQGIGKGINYQDLAVCGDYIMNFPLTLGMGIGDYLQVYSISRDQIVAEPKLDFQFENIVQDEPESICETEPGVFLAAVCVVDAEGKRKFRLYETEIPYYFDVTVLNAEGQEVSKEKVLRGEEYVVDMQSVSEDQVTNLVINGQEAESVQDTMEYKMENVQEDYIVQAQYQTVPEESAQDVSVVPDVNGKEKTGFSYKYLFIGAGLFVLAIATALYYVHIRMERKRKCLRAKRKRQIAAEY